MSLAHSKELISRRHPTYPDRRTEPLRDRRENLEKRPAVTTRPPRNLPNRGPQVSFARTLNEYVSGHR